MLTAERDSHEIQKGSVTTHNNKRIVSQFESVADTRLFTSINQSPKPATISSRRCWSIERTFSLGCLGSNWPDNWQSTCCKVELQRARQPVHSTCLGPPFGPTPPHSATQRRLSMTKRAFTHGRSYRLERKITKTKWPNNSVEASRRQSPVYNWWLDVNRQLVYVTIFIRIEKSIEIR